MMKNLIKKYASVVLVAMLSILLVGVSDVYAVTVKESALASSPYDKIADGTIIVGNTKFSAEDVIVSGLRISQAALDFAQANVNNPAYDGGNLKIYYYTDNMWFEYDIDNNPVYIGDATAIESLDIYYINNQDKMLDVPYTGATSNLTFRTDKANKNAKVRLEGNTLKVPATVMNLTVLSNNIPTATFARGSMSDASFFGNPNGGKIVSRDSLTSLGDDNSITFDGVVPFKANPDDERLTGNAVKVGIMADRVPTDREATKIIVKDAGTPEGREFAWGTSNGDLVRDIDVLLSKDSRNATIEIVWQEGNRQSFEVKLTSTSTFIDSPDGTIDSDDSYEVDKDSIKDTVIILEGAEIPYTPADGTLSGGNRVNMVIIPNDSYVDIDTSSVNVAITKYDSEGNLLEEVEDAVPTWDEGYMFVSPKVTENGRIIKIAVTWEPGFTQVFTVDATNATLLAE